MKEVSVSIQITGEPEQAMRVLQVIKSAFPSMTIGRLFRLDNTSVKIIFLERNDAAIQTEGATRFTCIWNDRDFDQERITKIIEALEKVK